MGKKRTYKKYTKSTDNKTEGNKDNGQQKTTIPKLKMKRALERWKKRNPFRALAMEDYEAVELFVKKYIPSLIATQREFDDIFKKY